MISPTIIKPPAWSPSYEESVASVPAVLAPGTSAADVPVTRPAAAVSPLLRFLLVLLVACGLTCVYLWQLGTVTTINLETKDLQAQIDGIEHQNVDLMLDVATQTTPGQIEREARALGMQAAPTPVFVTLQNGSPAQGETSQYEMPGTASVTKSAPPSN
jgi:hypothetical protein